MRRSSAPPHRGRSEAPPPEGVIGARVRLAHGEIVVLSYPIPDSANGKRASALTVAERDVAMRVLAGHSNARIARERGTSMRTVANQVSSILRKLGVRSRSELVASRALFRS